jgi:two-component system, LytTR family, sensor kinase
VADDIGITFFCQNHIFPSKEIKESTGIGLVNTKKRLQFLYPNRHLLNIDTEEKLFTVTLTLRTTYSN